MSATIPSAGPPTTTSTSTSTPIEAKVSYQNRSFTDIWFGILYILNFIGFLTCGFIIASNAHPRYHVDTETGERSIHEYYYNDVVQCCASDGENVGAQANGLCYYVNELINDDAIAGGGGRRRHLQAGNSNFDQDEGIFDAYLEAPEIICGLLALTLSIAILWGILLRFFAKPVVFLTEAVKIAGLIALAVHQTDTSSRVIFILLAIGVGVYTWYFRLKIILAAKMMEQSVVALKANPSVFVGGIFTKLLFAGNAALFVFFFSESFNVTNVARSETWCYTDYSTNLSGEERCSFSCDWSYPDYVSDINIYLGVSYLWTIMLLEQTRLSIISTIIGSWHFHPTDIPSVFKAILNSIYSFGTLAISSLISAIAEKLNRMINQPSCTSWCGPAFFVTAPLSILLCFFGTCIKATIQMLTKYAVVMHSFTGKPFVQAGKDAFGLLSRHFVGGFVTEVTSQSVLTLASYVFSYGVTMLTWIWIDRKFDCDSFPSNSEEGNGFFAFLMYTFLILFHLWFPVLGLYIMILINRVLQNNPVGQGTQHMWVPPLASIFVGCIAMMFFLFLSRIFLDTINVKFMCYAIDKENRIQKEENKEFETLLKEVPGYIESSSTVSSGTADVESYEEGRKSSAGVDSSGNGVAVAVPVSTNPPAEVPRQGAY